MNPANVALFKTINGIISLVIDNNLSAVNVNLQNAGLAPDPVSREQAYNMIRSMLNDGKEEQVMKLLNVPFRLDASNGTEQYFPDLVESYNELYPNAPIGDANYDWGKVSQLVFGDVLNAVVTPITPSVEVTDTNAPGKAKPDHTLLYIILAIIAVLLLLSLLK